MVAISSMAKINHKRLLFLLIAISFLAEIAIGLWYLIQNFNSFELQYYNQRQIEYVDAKYKKPYFEWLKNSRKECIADFEKSIQFNTQHEKSSFHWGNKVEALDHIHELCEKGYSEILITQNETIVTYLKHIAGNMVAFLIAAAFLSYLISMLVVFWLPLAIRSFTYWITTNQDENS